MVEREDVVLFVNASFACTRQDEFYGDSRGQAVSVGFLHDYMLGNYRRMYARTLAIGINHMNQAEVIVRLLASGSDVAPDDRAEEGELIRLALRRLPPPRVLRLFSRLRKERVNNRRTRAVIRDYLAGRRDPVYDAVKYRTKVAGASRHAHISWPEEHSRFLFGPPGGKPFEAQLFESYRKAHFSAAAVYDLPYTVAEGLAQKHGIPRPKFLKGIEPRLTEGERLRLQRASQKELDTSFSVDLGRAGLTKLCLYVLSMSVKERQARSDELTAALDRAAAEAATQRGARERASSATETDLRFGRVACVLDRSYSSSGSRTKRRRPLAVALGTSRVAQAIATEARSFWTVPLEGSELCVTAAGQTNLVDPLIDALEWGPDLVLIVSDGHENDPTGGVQTIVATFRRDLDPEHRVTFVHINPVFDAELFEPRSLGPALPTVGVRDAEDLTTMLAFARFADGGSDLAALEAYLAGKVAAFLGGTA